MIQTKQENNRTQIKRKFYKITELNTQLFRAPFPVMIIYRTNKNGNNNGLFQVVIIASFKPVKDDLIIQGTK